MRELQLWTQTEAAKDSFEDITELAQSCHFTNCRHLNEPRCAVKQAIEDGDLAPERLDGYLKLQDELQSLEARKNARALIDAKRNVKTTSKALKKFYKSRD